MWTSLFVMYILLVLSLYVVVFLKFDGDFYEEDEDIGGVNVTVEMVGFGFVPITASGPVDFNLRIVGGTGRSAAEGTYIMVVVALHHSCSIAI